jgi:hypothetical protein
MPRGAWIVGAMDNDDAGRDLSALIERAVKDTGRRDLMYIDDLPEAEGADWNDVLRAGPAGPNLRPLVGPS